MDSALIVSSSDQSAAALSAVLRRESFTQIMVVKTAAETRRLINTTEYDLFIINTPLSDEEGSELARQLAERLTGEVVILVREEKYNETLARQAEFGIIAISKPIQPTAFWQALKLAEAMHRRSQMVQADNRKLQRKLDEIKIIDRAKLLLITRMNMSEPEAHRYIERQAMDRRMTKREIADGIIGTYQY